MRIGRRTALKALVLAGAFALVGARAEARSPFDDLWVAALDTQMGQAGFDDYLVADGIYKCQSCRPPRT